MYITVYKIYSHRIKPTHKDSLRTPLQEKKIEKPTQEYPLPNPLPPPLLLHGQAPHARQKSDIHTLSIHTRLN